MTYSREILRHDLKAKSQIARFSSLRPSESMIQSAFFDIEPAELEQPACDHPVTEPQLRLDGGSDQVCVTCGARV